MEKKEGAVWQLHNEVAGPLHHVRAIFNLSHLMAGNAWDSSQVLLGANGRRPSVTEASSPAVRGARGAEVNESDTTAGAQVGQCLPGHCLADVDRMQDVAIDVDLDGLDHGDPLLPYGV